ncbi:L-ornithine N5-oxygenase [Capronia epimyces CBS 606.96]|uniref:L-ornithine N(5)-monooxygenase n=1 Tax=Capronia epimyces CBS 606.96 TaxID=1182542 RepID=W9XCJ2_9EURO|nr:L-ornithine N5-oxygenase [Capronia epimyces CBS 606.96]EXJ78212.1 L-ornithine N5-oxygenase [Capronia epimyces CBS 606.96]
MNPSAATSSPVQGRGPSRPLHAPAKLHAPALEEVHDLLSVGFGPASLAVAIALSDSLQQAQAEVGQVANVPRVRFLEKQRSFKWHSGMLLPGAKMQISFIKDLATLRDPRSYFTFLNYLKEHDRLVSFTNLSTFLPSRLEFDDYLQWAARHFDNVVEYGQQVESIRPHKLGGQRRKYDCFEVVSRNLATGETTSFLTRNVIIAAGGTPVIPAIFKGYGDRALHSSEYLTKIERVLPDKATPYSIAVVGSGQSGAEVFNDLHSRYPNATTRLIFRDTALRPSDDSPFVNEVFNPDAIDTFFEATMDVRNYSLNKNRATNYSVVRLELIEKIYDELYLQGIKEPDPVRWQHRLLSARKIVGVGEDEAKTQLRLMMLSSDPSRKRPQEILSFDCVVLATGYRRDSHIAMLKGCQPINAEPTGQWQPGRDYGLKLNRETVAEGTGIWLQGCNEKTHGLSDSLLSVLSTRSAELVESIFGKNFNLGSR